MSAIVWINVVNRLRSDNEGKDLTTDRLTPQELNTLHGDDDFEENEVISNKRLNSVS